jgi:RES domain
VLPYVDLVKALAGLTKRSIPGPWYRAVVFDHLLKPPPSSPPGSPAQALWPGGAQLKGARFTPKCPPAAGINCLYLATDELTPVVEVAGVYRPTGSTVDLKFEPQVLMTVVGVLTSIVDLTQPAAQSKLGTSHAELTGEWLVPQDDYLAGKGPMPPTQMLGQAAYDEGTILGLAYRSTKSSSGKLGLVIFTDRLAKALSYLELHNKPAGTLKQYLP